jgi:V/A-type H+/Na+-transporting ATPase subunit D
MAKKIKLTRPELKRQRDALQRFQRYLPMLKLKQQQLQMMVREAAEKVLQAQDDLDKAQATFEPYRAILADRAGVNLEELATPAEVHATRQNIAGVHIPVFEGVEFPPVSYSLFATPVWIDGALADMRTVNEAAARLDIVREQYRLLQVELTKITQRVNLFEKVKIPECQEAIRRIRIHLGDEMTAGVGRAKIAKSKITRSEQTVYETQAAGAAQEVSPA